MYKDQLIENIRTLNEIVWENHVTNERLTLWLENFNDTNIEKDIEKQKLIALHLLSQVMYFGVREIRALLKYIYEELFKYPIIREIRKINKNSLDLFFLKKEFNSIINKTRFLGMGNPSESGVHLLYFFRQENSLPKDMFINTHEIFSYEKSELSIRNKKITKYIFIDDYCGSGDQAKQYSSDIVEKIKDIVPNSEISYFVLFATKKGIENVKKNTKFDKISSVYLLDESFECFHEESRYFVIEREIIDKTKTKEICEFYGSKICNKFPLGYKNGQKLICFCHNTPDNTLPIFWGEKNDTFRWYPIFKRYQKIYYRDNL